MNIFGKLIAATFTSFLISTTAIAGAKESLAFFSDDKKVKLVFSLSKNSGIDVFHNGKSVYKVDIGELYGQPVVIFGELNGDDVQDIIIRLEDESGFEPLILLSKPGTNQYVKTLIGKSLKVDYSNLETEIPGKLNDAYTIKLNKNGSKYLIFDHLYIGRTFKQQVILQLNSSKTDYIIQ